VRRVPPREVEKEQARSGPCTRAEARRRVTARWRQGYQALAAARHPGVRFASEGIAEAIGRIESIAQGD
jgi:hypothetical protein